MTVLFQIEDNYTHHQKKYKQKTMAFPNFTNCSHRS